MYCSYCGKEVEDNIKFCPYCGKKIPQEILANQSTAVSKKSRFPHKIPLLLIGAVIAIFILIIYSGVYKEYIYIEPSVKNDIASAKVGDRIYFGNYKDEDIVWRVLDKNSDQILIISEYGLDAQPYNTTRDHITWENCSLREWLNYDFYNEAFTANEQKKILTTLNGVVDSIYGVNDEIFLLSKLEAEKYFKNSFDRECYATTYTANIGVDLPLEQMFIFGHKYNGHSVCPWWLRDSYGDTYFARGIDEDGKVVSDEYTVDTISMAVRPAMWISIDQ